MARPRKPFPSYLRHSQTGRGIVIVRNHDGSRRTISLPGPFGSDESKAAYQQLLTILGSNAGRLPPASRGLSPDLRVAELADRFDREKVQVEFARGSGEFWCYRQAIKVLCRIHGRTLVREFDAAALEGVRRAMIAGSWMTDAERARAEKERRPIGWSRGTINKQISRVRGIFRWGVPLKLVPVSVVTDLECLAPLRRGKGVREAARVAPATPEDVAATLPHLPPIVHDMVEVQMLSGARPGELCALRVRDLDMTGDVWIYRPRKHKTEHLGHGRTIAFGPQAQAILRRYVRFELEAFLFSPAAQAELIKAAKRAARKTPVQPSQVDRTTPKPRKRPGERFTTQSYTRSIVRACRKAGVKPWHAHQVRHLWSLIVRRSHGIEAARASLGHRHVDMAMHYGGVDTELAIRVARAMG